MGCSVCAIATGLREATGDERDVLPTGLWLPPPSSPLTFRHLPYNIVLGLITQFFFDTVPFSLSLFAIFFSCLGLGHRSVQKLRYDLISGDRRWSALGPSCHKGGLDPVVRETAYTGRKQ